MEALKRIECQDYGIEVILLVAKKLSFQERTLAEELGISYIENFKM